MCDHVLARGHEVTVHDPYAPAVAPRQAAGARVASSPADAARGADVVCVVVRDDAEARSAVADPVDGVVAGAAPGTAVLLHSTVSPGTIRDLAALCSVAGLTFLDAPISGGREGAVAGTLVVMCGGTPAAVDAVRPVVESFASEVVRFGDVGAGMAAKLARNAAFYTVWCALHEAMALAEAAGLDLAAFARLVRGTGVPDVHRSVLDRPTTQPFDEAEDPERAAAARHTLALGWKDLAAALQLADELGVAAPFAATARRSYGAANGLPVDPPA
jgi:3-hydroxyisobutyrate dehydrogenase